MMKTRAAATAKLLEDTAAYMRGVKEARSEDIASKREREVGASVTGWCQRAVDTGCVPHPVAAVSQRFDANHNLEGYGRYTVI